MNERKRRVTRKAESDVQQCGDGDATAVDPAEEAGGMAVVREREQHARARVERRVRG